MPEKGDGGSGRRRGGQTVDSPLSIIGGQKIGDEPNSCPFNLLLIYENISIMIL